MRDAKKAMRKLSEDKIPIVLHELNMSLSKDEIPKAVLCGAVLVLLEKLRNFSMSPVSEKRAKACKKPASEINLTRPEFVDIFLKSINGAEVAIIRILRSETELGIKQIRKLVSEFKTAPILKNVRFSKAQKILELLKMSGARVSAKAASNS